MQLVMGMVSLAALVAAAPGGCSRKESEAEQGQVVVAKEQAQAHPPAPAQAAPMRAGKEPSPIAAPVTYMKAAVDAKGYAERSLDISYLRNEIKQFYALEGRLPRSLKELEHWRGEPLPGLPNGYTYNYDPNTGKVEASRSG